MQNNIRSSSKPNSLSVIFRTCPHLSKKFPKGITKNESIDIVLNSFLDSVNNSLFDLDKFVFINDNFNEENIIKKKIEFNSEFEYIHHPTTERGNHNSFRESLNKASEMTSDFILFLEDDYFFEEDCFRCFYDISLSQDFDFFTPYYHPNYDKYGIFGAKEIKKISYQNSKLRLVSAPSTTLTFICRNNSFKIYKSSFDRFSKKIHDFKIWSDITHSKLSCIDLINLSLLKVYLKYFYFMIFDKSKVNVPKATLLSIYPSMAMHLCIDDKPTQMYSFKNNKFIKNIYEN